MRNNTHGMRPATPAIFFQFTLCVWVGLIGMVASGCSGSLGTGSKTPESGEAKDHAHEHFPEHWPHTIFAASQRLSELVQAPNTPSPHHSITPRKEFSDLVSWLPILAADSDLDREVFDRIDAWSREQSAILSRFDPGSISLEDVVANKEVQVMVDWLSETCQAEQRRLNQLLQ